jgi:Zn-dependent metalloprotease
MFMLVYQSIAIVPTSFEEKLPFARIQITEANGTVVPEFSNWDTDNAGLILPEFLDWQIYRYENSNYIALMVGKPIPILKNINDDHQVKIAVNEIFSSLKQELGLINHQGVVSEIHRPKNLVSVLVHPEINNTPVYGANTVFTFNSRGELISVKANGYGDEVTGSFDISESTAIESARKLTGISHGAIRSSKVFLPVISEGIVRLHAVHHIELDSDHPGYQPELFINSESGEVLAAENRVYYDRVEGQVTGSYQLLYPDGEGGASSFRDELMTVANQQNYTNANGNFSFNVDPNDAPYTLNTALRGRWVTVIYEDGDNARINYRVNRPGEENPIWSDDNSRIDERNLYYQTNFMHAWYKELDPNFDGLDFAIDAICEYENNYNNAMWYGRGMAFGNGNVLGNLALHADVIYHEYSHGVTGRMYQRGDLPYRDEPGAMNEAWADYFACTNTNEPQMGEDADGGGQMRTMENEYVYPKDIRGEVHWDGRIIGAALWHTRVELGHEYADELIHYAKYLLANRFLTYFGDILFTDDNDGDITNGTPNDEVIYEQWGRHGIGPGLTPKLVVERLEMFDDNEDGSDGNGNLRWEPGETIRLEIDLYRPGSFFPPPAENTYIELSTDHPNISMMRSSVEFRDFRVGDRFSSDRPLLFSIDDDAELSFATFYYTINSNDGDFELSDSIRVTIGTPSVLLVRDGETALDRTEHFEAALDTIGLIYDKITTWSEHPRIDQMFSEFETVIWYTGDSDGNDDILSRTSVSMLENFLDEGGNLLLSGQSASSVRSAQQFLAGWLGVISLEDSVFGRALIGVEGDVVAKGDSLLLLGSPGARNQVHPGSIAAMEPAVEIFHWMRVQGNPAGGIRRIDPDTGAKSIFLSFGLESVSGAGETTKRDVVLRNMLEWFDVELPNSAPQTADVPQSFEIFNPYPNPFNSVVNMPFRLDRAGHVAVSVYDPLGRLMWSDEANFPIGKSQIAIDSGNWGTGLYFINVVTFSDSKTFKIVQIK